MYGSELVCDLACLSSPCIHFIRFANGMGRFQESTLAKTGAECQLRCVLFGLVRQDDLGRRTTKVCTSQAIGCTPNGFSKQRLRLEHNLLSDLERTSAVEPPPLSPQRIAPTGVRKI